MEKHHGVKGRCEGEFIKATALLRESNCTSTKLCKYEMADVTDVDLLWSNYNTLKMDY